MQFFGQGWRKGIRARKTKILPKLRGPIKQKCSQGPGYIFFRAEDEVRTRDLQLGKLTLYQLSYFRGMCAAAGGF
jgi:hypothetical protein